MKKKQIDYHPIKNCPLCLGEGIKKPRRIVAWGLCDTHYRQQRKLREIGKCKTCGKEDLLFAAGLCLQCFKNLTPKETKYLDTGVYIPILPDFMARIEKVCKRCHVTPKEFITEAIECQVVKREMTKED